MSQEGLTNATDLHSKDSSLSDGTELQEQVGSSVQAGQGTLGSDPHQPDNWTQDTTNTARLQVVDENQKFT